MSAVRVQTMAIILPSGFGMSAIDAWNLTFPSCSFLKAANSAPPGPSAPPPRNHGSTISVSVAEGTSPSRICFAWYQPMPRPGMPQPTSATGVVEAARVASHRGAPRCSLRRASILAMLSYVVILAMVHRCAAKNLREQPVSASIEILVCRTHAALSVQPIGRTRNALVLHPRTASGASWRFQGHLRCRRTPTSRPVIPTTPSQNGRRRRRRVTHGLRTLVTPTPPPRRAPHISKAGPRAA